MAIALDTSSASGLKTTAQSKTWLHTCTGSDLILFVGCFGDNDNDNITGITYNSVPLTLINKVQVPSDRWLYLYYLIAPATGEHSILVSESPAEYFSGFGVSYTGVKQSDQPDNNTTKTDTAKTSITTALTTVADNCWTILLGKNLATPSAGTGSTVRQVDSGIGVFDSNGAITPAGEYSMQITYGSNTSWATIMASLAPASAGNFDYSGTGSFAFSGAAITTIDLSYTGQTGKWSGLGMGLFYQQLPYVEMLLANGFTELRMDIPDWDNGGEVTASKAAVISAVALGANVIWGVSSFSTTLTTSNWTAFSNAVKAAATWAQANGVYEFQIGNEEENHTDEDTIRSWVDLVPLLKTLATAVQAIFTNGNVSYTCANDSVGMWVSEGRGDIDLLASNVYMELGDWEAQIDAMVAGFGVEHTYITEFNLNPTSLDTYSTDEAVQAAAITEMIDYIKASGITRALYFNLWSDEFGAIKEDDSYRLLWWSLLNSGGASFIFSGSATQSYGYNFNTVAEGSFAFSGSATYVLGLAYTGSGSFDFSSAGTYILGFAYTASGSLAFSGTATAYVDTRHYVTSASGSVGFSGAASYILGFTYTATGSFGYSGAAITTIGFSCSGNGSLDFSGTATQLHSKYYLYTGAGTSFVYSGSAAQIHGYNFNTNGFGSFNYSGSAIYYKELGYIAIGSFTFSGTATQSYTWNYSCVASGGLNLSGVGACLLGFSYGASGSLSFSGEGAYVFELSYIANGSGDFHFSGSAFCSYDTEIPPEDFIYAGQGSFVLSGSALQDYTFNYLYLTSGTFLFSGEAVVQKFNFVSVGSGILTYSGEAIYHYCYSYTKIDKDISVYTKIGKEISSYNKINKGC